MIAFASSVSCKARIWSLLDGNGKVALERSFRQIKQGKVQALLVSVNSALGGIAGRSKTPLVINMKTARMLGIRIPDAVRLRADEVIQ